MSSWGIPADWSWARGLLFVCFLYKQRQKYWKRENTFQFEKKKRLQMKHKPTVLSLVLRVVTGDFTWLYKSYSYIQGGPRRFKPTISWFTWYRHETNLWAYERTKPQVFFKQKVKRLHETLETRVKCDHCLVSWWARKWLKKNTKVFLIRTSFYSIVNIFCS